MSLTILFIGNSSSFGQLNEGGTPVSFQIEKQLAKANVRNASSSKQLKTVHELPSHQTGNLSRAFIKSLIEKEKQDCPTCRSEAYGYTMGVDIDIMNVAAKELLDDGSTLYRYKVTSDSANGFQFVFKNFKIPTGGKLYVYNEDHSMVIGAFTNNNNVDGGVYALQPVMGNEVTIEYFEPKGTPSAKLVIENIVYVFSNSLERSGVGPYFVSPDDKKYPCTIDVNCPLGLGWEKEAKSVGLMLKVGTPWSLSLLGSGALINNSKEDGKPYFLTASHLLGDVPSLNNGTYDRDLSKVVILFNHQNLICDGDAATAQTTQSISGVSLITRDIESGSPERFTSEHMLFLLKERPVKYDVCYSGWSAIESEGNQANLVGISHPRGDVKKIHITDDDLPTPFTKQIQRLLDGWKVYWKQEQGITQPGSSGSPLYNSDHRIVAHLYGGTSDCSSSGADYYAKFATSFVNGKLGQWLTPGSTSIKRADTYCPTPILTKIVDFKANKLELLTYELVSFENLTFNTAGNVTYLWDLGSDAFPATTSTLMNPDPVSYPSPGFKTISLMVCDNNGCIVETKSYYIQVSLPSKTMVVDFVATNRNVFTGKEVSFTSTVSGYAGTLKYAWDFGKGADVPPGFEAIANPTVSWKEDGNKTISLVVTDKDGATIETKAYYVNVYKNLSNVLDVNFTYMKPLIRNRKSVFTNITPFASDDDPNNKFTWDFGDGTTSNLPNPDHTYTQTGIYSVKLEICNKSGCYTKQVDDVVVSPYYASTDFVINGKDWLPGDFPIEIGYNTPVEYSYRGQNIAGYGYKWDLDAPGIDVQQQRIGYGPHYTYYFGNGLKSVNLYKYDDITGSTGNKYKSNSIVIIPGKGTGTCRAYLGDITLSSNCYNAKADPITVSIPMTKANCHFYKQISGTKYGSNPLNDTTLHFNAGTVFPFTDDFVFELIHYDGVTYTVMDRKSMSVTIYNSTASAGGVIKSCPVGSFQLGVSTQPGAIYSWSAFPASAINLLSATNISNPVANITNEGNYQFTVTLKDMASSCVNSSTAYLYINNISVTGQTYNVSKSEATTLALLTKGGSTTYTNYSWTPASYLNSATTAAPLMTAPNVAGTYTYKTTVTDNKGCTGIGNTTVIVSATAPSSLIATPSISQIQLDWVDNATTEDSYIVYRASGGSAYVALATLPANSVTYIDNAVVYGTQYSYKINAVEGVKNLGYSNTVSSTPQYIAVNSGTSTMLANGEKTIKTSDGGYMMAGTANSNYFVVKYNSCGTKEWEKAYGGTGFDGLSDLVETPDGYILAGSSSSGISGDRTYASRGYQDFWIIKINKVGTKQWDRAYGGNNTDLLTKIIATSDGGFMLAGHSTSWGRDRIKFINPKNYEKSTTSLFDWVWNYNYFDFWVVKIDRTGNLQFDKTYSNWLQDNLYDAVQIADGSYCFIGYTASYNATKDSWGRPLIGKARYAPKVGLNDIWILRTDANGNQISDQAIGLPNKSVSYSSITKVGSNYLLAANVNNNTNNDYWVVSFNSNFQIQWQKTYGGNGADNITGITKGYDNAFLVYGNSSTGINGDKSIAPTGNWVIKIDPNNGNKIWDHTVSNAFPFNFIEEVSDKNFVAAGTDAKYNLVLSSFAPSNASAVLKTGVVSPLAYYPGASIVVPYTVKCAVATGNIFSIQLSNEEGSFAFPTVIGTIQSSASSGKISTIIPFNTFPGNGYRIRVVSSNPAYIGSDNGQYITILKPEIVTSVINPKTYGINQDVTVSFILKGLVRPVNRFKVQLSDASGNFNNYTNLGIFKGTTSASYVVKIPNGQMFSDKYRIRVIAVGPSIIGLDNGDDITIGDLITEDPSILSYKQGTSITVPYLAIANFKKQNVFSLQLSDINGSFLSSFTVIGTQASASSGTITGIIPMNTLPGSKYRVRIIASNPKIDGVINPSNISISPPSISTEAITPLRYIAYDAVAVPFSVEGVFNSDNVFTAQLSDAYGYFGTPLTIGTITGIGNSSIPAVLPGVVSPGNAYRIRVVSSSPAITGTDNGVNISIGALATGNISPSFYYTGKNIAVPYTTNISFGTANVFTAQLSDAAGEFNNPIVIGTLSATGSGTISGWLPLNIPQGSGYRIRVVASEPNLWSLDNGNDITILPPHLTIGTVPSADLCRGNYITIPYYIANGNYASGNIFSVQISDNNGDFTNPRTIGMSSATGSGSLNAYLPDDLPSGSSYQIRIQSSNPFANSASTSLTLITPAITYTGSLSLCSGTGNQVILNAVQNSTFTYQWYKDNIAIASAQTNSYAAIDPGVYTVAVTDADAGCTKSSDPITIVTQLVPTLSIDAGPICKGSNSAQPVTWTKLQAATLSADGHTFTRTSASAFGIAQTEDFLATDGYFEMTLNSLGFILSFDRNEIINAGTMQQYKINTKTSGSNLSVLITENNNFYPGMTDYPVKMGDKLKVALESGVVVFYINNSKIYTSGLKPILPLRCNLHSTTSSNPVTINKGNSVTFDAVSTNIIGTPSYSWSVNNIVQASTSAQLLYDAKEGDVVNVKLESQTPCGSSLNASVTVHPATTVFSTSQISVSPDNVICNKVTKTLTWTSLVACVVGANGTTLVNKAASGAWNAGASSVENLSEGDFLTFKVTSFTNMAIGLSKTDLNINYTSIGYAFLLNTNGTMYLSETGIVVYVSSYVVGDVLQVGIENGVVVYYKNNVKLRVSNVPYTTPIVVDVSMNSVIPIDVFINVRNQLRTFTVSGVNNYTQGIVNWFINNTLVKTTTNDFLFTRSMTTGDVVHAEIITANQCEASPVVTNKLTFYSTPQVTAPHTHLCSGQPLTLKASSSEMTYSWYKDGVLIPGEVSDQLIVTTMGSYSVTFANQGCGSTSTGFNVNSIKTSPVVTVPADIAACPDSPFTIKATANERTYLTFNGVDTRLVSDDYYGQFGSFSMQFWALPTATHEIDPESTSGAGGLSGQRFVIYPNPSSYYRDAGPTYAGVGVSVGTNGVSVYEHSDDNYFPAVLVWQGTITDWTHITVVYINFVPSLYINGVLVKTTIPSGKVSMTSIGISSLIGPYKGHLDGFILYPGLTSQQVLDSYNNIMPAAIPSFTIQPFPMDEGSGTILHSTNTYRQLAYTMLGGGTWNGPKYTWTNGTTVLPNTTNTLTTQTPSSTIYTVTVSDKNSCTASASTNVSMTTPQKIHVSEDQTICAGKTATISGERFASFDGVYNYITANDFQLSTTGSPLSVSVRVKIPSSHAKDAAIFSLGDLGYRASAHISATDRHLYFEYGFWGRADFTMDIDFTAYYDKWVNIVMVSGGNLQQYRAIYIDGVLIKTLSTSSGSSIPLKQLSIGSFGFIQTKHFMGLMSNFAMWGRVLTANEVSMLSNEESISSTSLLVNYPMPERRDMVFKDKSGFGNDAIIYAGLTWEDDPTNFSALAWSSGNSTNSFTVTPSVTTSYTVTSKDKNSCPSESVVTITVDPTCPVYNAFNFKEYSNKVVTIPMKSNYKMGVNDFTIEAKIIMLPTDRGGPILVAKESGIGFVLLYESWIDAISISIPSSGTEPDNYYMSNSGLGLFDGNCHHIAVTRSGTILSFVVDGVVSGMKTISNSYGLFSNSTFLYIGNIPYSGTFDGKIKEVRLWNTARSPAKLKAYANVKNFANDHNLVGYWSAEAVENQIVIDGSYLKNYGILGNYPLADNFDPMLSVETCNSGLKIESLAFEETTVLTSVSISISPNPFESSGANLFVHNTSENFSELIITDVNGTLIYKAMIENNKTHSILNQESPGVYIVRVKSKNETVISKAIKL